MDNKIVIVAAGIKDIPTIRALASEIWPVAYGNILSADQLQYMLQLIYSNTALSKQIEMEQHRFLLVYLHGEAVGFASFSMVRKPAVFKLQKIYVRTDIQGHGLGKALLANVITIITSEGAEVLQLNMNRQNLAKGFYEKAGFRIIREENIDIGNGYFMNDYVMEKQLLSVPPDNGAVKMGD